MSNQNNKVSIPYPSVRAQEIEDLVVEFVSKNKLCIKTWEEIEVGDLFFPSVGFLLSYKGEKYKFAVVINKSWDKGICSIEFIMNELLDRHRFIANNKYYYIVVQELNT